MQGMLGHVMHIITKFMKYVVPLRQETGEV